MDLEKKGGLKKRLAEGIVAGGLALSLAGGCMQTPDAGEFKKRSLVAVPAPLPVMALYGGRFYFEKIIEDGGWRGVKIRKKHWTGLGKQRAQEILFPKGVENVGIDNFQDRIWISYELLGDKFLERYDIGFAAGKCKLKSRRIFDRKEGKYIKIKRE